MSEIYHLDKYIPIVCSQTNYTKEEAENKLEKWNGDYIKVIKEYLNPNFEKEIKKEPVKSVNQQIMTEIRNFCDKQMSDYQKRKEKSKN
tara:strand:+ start:343 stop:609 length:267 start_codon:yes stop_codon:yes gene_type:complete